MTEKEIHRRYYLKKLKERGEIPKKEKIANRRKLLLDLLPYGLSQKEMSIKLGFSEGVIQEDMKFIKEAYPDKYKEYKKVKNAEIQSRRERLLDLLPYGLSQREMSVELGISNSIVKSDMIYIKEIFPDKYKEYKSAKKENQINKQRIASTNTYNKKITKRRILVYDMWLNGHSVKEISEVCKVCEGTVWRDIAAFKKSKYMRSQQLINRLKELHKILLLMSQELSGKDISEKLNIPYHRATEDIRYLKGFMVTSLLYEHHKDTHYSNLKIKCVNYIKSVIGVSIDVKNTPQAWACIARYAPILSKEASEEQINTCKKISDIIGIKMPETPNDFYCSILIDQARNYNIC